MKTGWDDEWYNLKLQQGNIVKILWQYLWKFGGSEKFLEQYNLPKLTLTVILNLTYKKTTRKKKIATCDSIFLIIYTKKSCLTKDVQNLIGEILKSISRMLKKSYKWINLWIRKLNIRFKFFPNYHRYSAVLIKSPKGFLFCIVFTYTK